MIETPTIISEPYAVLRQLANERRRVLSDWRALIFLRRSSFAIPEAERSWTRTPDRLTNARTVLHRMIDHGDIRPIESNRSIFLVITPYATAIPVYEFEVLFELNPYCALSHLTALEFHGLTTQRPRIITATSPTETFGEVLPIGTTFDDWDGLDYLPPARLPERVIDQPVGWTRMSPEHYFGQQVRDFHGYPIRVTDPERTLLDALNTPRMSGGIHNVMDAWFEAREDIDLNRLFHYVERFDIGVLRQRVGYILEELGITHPTLDAWQRRAQRGGSMRLVGSAPYSSNYSERWNLSLNGPVELLDLEAART